MRLSAEHFKQIVSALKSDCVDAHSLRHEPRVGLAAEVTLINTAGPGPRAAKVRVRDISRTGIGLFHNQHMLKGQKFVLLLASNSERPLWLVCSVAYCRRADADRFSIGGHVVQLLRPEQVNRIQRESGLPMCFDDVVDIARASDAILT